MNNPPDKKLIANPDSADAASGRRDSSSPLPRSASVWPPAVATWGRSCARPSSYRHFMLVEKRTKSDRVLGEILSA